MDTFIIIKEECDVFQMPAAPQGHMSSPLLLQIAQNMQHVFTSPQGSTFYSHDFYGFMPSILVPTDVFWTCFFFYANLK